MWAAPAIVMSRPSAVVSLTWSLPPPKTVAVTPADADASLLAQRTGYAADRLARADELVRLRLAAPSVYTTARLLDQVEWMAALIFGDRSPSAAPTAAEPGGAP